MSSPARLAALPRLGLSFRRGLKILFALPVLLAAAEARESPGDGGETRQLIGFSDETSVSWVLVPLVVRDGTRYVRGLGSRDFRLQVDGREVPIESFEPGFDAPVGLVHLQDLSGSMANGGKLEAGREALAFFLDHLRGQDRLAVASFASGRTQVEVPFTGDRTAIAEALAAWEGYGTTALHDAVAWLPEIHLDRGPRRGAVVLVTDGVDNASVLSAAKARELVRRAEIPIYVVALGARRGAARPQASDPGAVFPEAPIYATVLRQLAAATTGRYYSIRAPGPRTGREVRDACSAILTELRHQYVLGFPTADSGPVEDRELRVEGPGKRLRITHRLGYRGTPPAVHRSSTEKENP